jgi:hypothetical protein
LILTTFSMPATAGTLTTAGSQQQQASQKQQGRQQQQGPPETLETLSELRTSTAVGMAVTAETLATAGTPEMSTAVKTTAAARTPATEETITTADVANIMAQGSLPVFFHLLAFFLHPFTCFSISGTCRVFTNPCLYFYFP